MKKTRALTIAAAVALLLVTGSAAAAGRCAYVDANGDGVCDHYALRWESGLRAGCQFIDENGDGVCDRPMAKSWPQRGAGNGFHRRCR